MTAEFQTLTFPTQAKFRTWLEKNHSKEPGLWIRYAKKGSGIKTVDGLADRVVNLSHKRSRPSGRSPTDHCSDIGAVREAHRDRALRVRRAVA